MKTKIYYLAICLLASYGFALSQNAKLSPNAKKMMNLVNNKQINNLKFNSEFICKTIANKTYLSSIIKVNNKINSIYLENLGIITGTKAGNIWTVQIPAEKFADFTKIKGIDYIQLDEPIYFEMDSARHYANVDSVHKGYSLPHPFSGKNVVIGIIDAGFDYTHPTFLDTNGINYRIKKVWEQKSTGTPPMGYVYGNEIIDSTSLWTTGSDAVIMSHGSHVAGIAAGSGLGSNNNQFRGVAYESDLVFVGIKPDQDQWTSTGMSNIIDGIKYVFDYAASVGKPAVVNLSWGCSIGSHDGSSLFSQACDNLCGNGKIFVCSAGNNGQNNIHATKTFTSSDTLTKTIVAFPTSLTEKKTWVDLWGEKNQKIGVSVSLYSGSTIIATSNYFNASDSIAQFYLLSATNDTCYFSITNTAAEINDKPRCFFEIYNKTTLKVCINITSKNGTIHIWTGYVKDYYGYYGYFSNPFSSQGITGNTLFTLGDMASTKSAIAVAAYSSRPTYTSIDGVITNDASYAAKGKIAPFSSKGNTIDNRVKPDIAAPGLSIGSAINSYDVGYQTGGADRSSVFSCYDSPINSKTYCYAMMMGTSMSSPMASGVIALMLEANPQLSANDLRAIFKQTAIKDNFTGVLPDSGNYIWGLGKINAFQSVKVAIDFIGINQVSSNNNNIIVYPNPASSNIFIDTQFDENTVLTMHILDLLGKEIETVNISISSGYNHQSIDISHLKNGIYVLSLTNDKTIFNYKLIKN